MSKSPVSETLSSSASVASDERTIERMERALEVKSPADKVAEGVRAGMNGLIGQPYSTARMEQSVKALLKGLNIPSWNVTVKQNADDPTVLDIKMDVPLNYSQVKVEL